jgi:uncharacterized protein YecT (DUF1311 family)
MPRGVNILAVALLALVLQPLGTQEGLAAQGNSDDTGKKDTAAVEACLAYVATRDQAASAGEPEASKDSGNVAAQAAKPSDDPGIEAYLQGKARSNARFYAHDCIGIVADACLALDENQSTDGMMWCFSREADVWDRLLNKTYKESLKPKAEDTDAARFKLVSDHVRKVQRAWIAWRDATCETLYQDGVPIYGSEDKVNSAYCEMLLTARQALSLDGTEPINFDQ